MSLMSCDDDILDTSLYDEITEEEFWQSTSDAKLFANGFYQDLPGWNSTSVGYSPNPDNNTDVSLYTSVSSRLNGTSSVPSSSTNWSFSDIREANYFLTMVEEIDIDDDLDLEHYKGEGYFFRAYYYWELLVDYGDLPIYDYYFDESDEDAVYAARDPRNEVVDFMLTDLDSAISKMYSAEDTETGRLCKEAAMLFKSRVALYEGTWEKYHEGTDFGVDGSDGSDYIEIAAEAAYEVIESGYFSLNSDYATNFNQTDLSSNDEILLWRQYDYVTYGSSYGNSAQEWPNRSGYTNFAVSSYLCTDGDPISVSDLYKGDLGLDSIEVNRDSRLAATIMVPGDVSTISTSGDTTYFSVASMSGNNSAVTAIEGEKYRDPLYYSDISDQTKDLAKIVFRYAEALLNYAEAKAELGSITQSDIDLTINLLRARVGMPNLTMSSITVDPDWPSYGYDVTDVLQEVRRERCVELMGEGFRFDDLMRWRAHELFQYQSPKGAYYEDDIYAEYSTLDSDSENYIDPFYDDLGETGYGFDEGRDYLMPIPTDELTLNENLEQNPGW
jgi:hypothetical protein